MNRYLAGFLGGLIGGFVRLGCVPKYYPKSYWTAGIVIGLILWGTMNLLFIVFGITTPSWALGYGSLITNLVTHLALGIIIAYALWLSRIKVTNHEEVR